MSASVIPITRRRARAHLRLMPSDATACLHPDLADRVPHFSGGEDILDEAVEGLEAYRRRVTFALGIACVAFAIYLAYASAPYWWPIMVCGARP